MPRMQLELDLDGGGGSNRAPGSPRTAFEAGTDLFAALRPTNSANRLATEIAHDLMRRFGVREAIRPLHVTLSALGRRSRFSTLDLAARKEELSSVALEPFMLVFDQLMSYDRRDGKKPLVLCCSSPNRHLLDLRSRIVEAQKQPGVEDGTARGFSPHMTLFYTHHFVRRQQLERAVEWLVADFHIIWSHTGECRHESLWRWPPLA